MKLKDILTIKGATICTYSTKVAGLVTKLRNLIKGNPIALLAFSHGMLNSRFNPKVGAACLGIAEEDAKKMAGEVAQILSEADGAGLLKGAVEMVKGSIKGTLSIKVQNSPMGRVLAEAMVATVNLAHRTITSGQFPMCLALPVPSGDDMEEDERTEAGLFKGKDGQWWKLNSALSRSLMKAMGIEIPKDDEGKADKSMFPHTFANYIKAMNKVKAAQEKAQTEKKAA